MHAALLQAHLGADGDFAVQRAPTFSEGHARADEADCALLDLTLPGAHGLETIEGRTGFAPEAPVIVVTGRRSVVLEDHDFLAKRHQ